MVKYGRGQIGAGNQQQNDPQSDMVVVARLRRWCIIAGFVDDGWIEPGLGRVTYPASAILIAVAVPAATAVTTPLSTVATLSLSLLHVTF